MFHGNVGDFSAETAGTKKREVRRASESISKRNTAGSEFITPGSCPLLQRLPHAVNGPHKQAAYTIHGLIQSFTCETAEGTTLPRAEKLSSGASTTHFATGESTAWRKQWHHWCFSHSWAWKQGIKTGRPIGLAEVLPGSEVHVDLRGRWTGHIVTCWQLCRSESGKLLLIWCQTGTWGDSEATADYFRWLDQGGNCWSGTLQG